MSRHGLAASSFFLTFSFCVFLLNLCNFRSKLPFGCVTLKKTCNMTANVFFFHVHHWLRIGDTSGLICQGFGSVVWRLCQTTEEQSLFWYWQPKSTATTQWPETNLALFMAAVYACIIISLQRFYTDEKNNKNKVQFFQFAFIGSLSEL